MEKESLVCIQFKGGARNEMWYTAFSTEVENGVVKELRYTFSNPEQKHHHLDLNEIQAITVKQTRTIKD